MTTQQVHYIITLAEEGSFSKAAKKLSVTQPSISQLIKNMEAQLGVLLFDRSFTPIRLTTVGQAYYDAAKKIQSTERELENRISEIHELKTGTLTIGTTPFRGAYMLPGSFSAFQAAFPEIKLNIITTNAGKLKSLLLSGEIDICIETGRFDPKLFYTEDLSMEHYYLAVGKSHTFNQRHFTCQLEAADIISDSLALSGQRKISIKDCLQEPFLILDAQTDDPDITFDLFNKENQTPKIALEARNLETILHWINAGLGIGILPDTMIRFGNFKEHPVYYRLQEPEGTPALTKKKIVAAYSKRHFLSQTASAYIHLLKQFIRQGSQNL
ncbi:MAG: LysR family transcriptional regulator [Lachnospiraceae bacterium]|nr:LysR family transcriptional regulator [Lachnospiraceae bacterium]